MSISCPLSSLCGGGRGVGRDGVEVSLQGGRRRRGVRKVHVRMHSTFLQRQRTVREMRTLGLSIQRTRRGCHVVRGHCLGRLTVLASLLSTGSIHLGIRLRLIATHAHIVCACCRLRGTYNHLWCAGRV